MKLKIANLPVAFLLTSVPYSASVANPADQNRAPTVDPVQLIGKRVKVNEIRICEPGTYKIDVEHSGMEAVVLSEQPSNTPVLPKSELDRLSPEVRENVLDRQQAVMLTLQFSDGSRRETCVPIGPRKLSEAISVVPNVPVTQGAGSGAKSQPTPKPSERASSDTTSVVVTEPQYINSFFALDVSGKLNSLDHETVTTFRSKARVLPGYAIVNSRAEFKPAHASVRLLPSAHFVVRGRSPIDPSSIYELRLLRVSKDHREILLTQAHGTIIGGAATSKMDEGVVPVKFESYGTDSYRITPEQPLTSGEYALSIRGVVTELYCFGVN
jgi:hypothetical protein